MTLGLLDRLVIRLRIVIHETLQVVFLRLWAVVDIFNDINVLTVLLTVSLSDVRLHGFLPRKL